MWGHSSLQSRSTSRCVAAAGVQRQRAARARPDAQAARDRADDVRAPVVPRHAHCQMGTIQETYSAIFQRALPYWWCIADLRGADPVMRRLSCGRHRGDHVNLKLNFYAESLTSSNPSPSAFATRHRDGV